MKFRFKAFGLHLLSSGVVLTCILGALYLGWYHWPGWHLADVSKVVVVMIAVDVVLGPSLTFVVAKSTKPRRELTRDIAIIVAVQLSALCYGTISLWNGRPLYYAFSDSVLQMVQAYDIDAHEAALGRSQNPALAPHWYSLPRWVCAPLPADPDERAKFVTSVISGGDDVISMPRLFKPWDACLPELHTQLKTVDKVAYFITADKKKLSTRMTSQGLKPDQPNAMPLTGRGYPLLAVFDKDLKLAAILSVK